MGRPISTLSTSAVAWKSTVSGVGVGVGDAADFAADLEAALNASTKVSDTSASQVRNSDEIRKRIVPVRKLRSRCDERFGIEWQRR